MPIAMNEMRATSIEGSMVHFDFECPGCQACGELEIDVMETDLNHSFGCPDGCGASFIILPWTKEGRRDYRIRCVMLPIFKKAG